MNLSNGLLFSLLVSVSPLLAHPFASWHTWQSLGVQQSFTFGPSHESSTLGYVSAGATGKWKGFDVDLGLRAESYGGLRSSRLEILSASLAKSYGSFQLRMGWQKIAWGETFGFYIADLVNPRDYSNPWLNDIDWMRLSVPALQFKWLGDALSIETVLTPIPRRPLLPNQKQVGLSRDFAIPLEGYPEYPHERKLQSMEGGARIGYLTSWGTDFSLIGYRHWNRNLVYEASFTSGAFSLNPVLHRTTTWGVCASHAFEAIVLRMDSVYHIKQPWASRFYGLITRQNVWETVVGADYTLEDGSIALQAHHDQWSYGSRQAASLRLASRQQPNGFQLELFGYAGIGRNHDLWVQPRISWSIDARWQLKLDLNVLKGSADPWKPETGMIAQRDCTAFLWITIKI